MNARTRLEENPFSVLGIAVDAGRAEVERAAQLLLAQLELSVEGVRIYDTPLGPRERTPELVRAAASELRDPDRRLVHEFWAVRDAGAGVIEDADPTEGAAPKLMGALGWRGRT